MQRCLRCWSKRTYQRPALAGLWHAGYLHVLRYGGGDLGERKLVGDYNMKAIAELVFIGEIVKQAKIAKRASERLEATSNRFDEIEVWSSIQSILVAAGNVSKILWPSRKSSLARGKTLRTLLNVNDRNLLSDRKFRNHFEHYDERIEDWFENNRSAVYADSTIDPFRSIWGGNIANSHRAYNPLTQTLTFRDESVDLAALLNALDEIRHNCSHLALS